METLKSAIDTMRLSCYIGSADLSEVFYSINVKIWRYEFLSILFW